MYNSKLSFFFLNKNILYQKVGVIHCIGFKGNGGVKRGSSNKEKQNNPIFSTRIMQHPIYNVC